MLPAPVPVQTQRPVQVSAGGIACTPKSKLQLILCARVCSMLLIQPLNIIIYHYQCRRNDNLITVRAPNGQPSLLALLTYTLTVLDIRPSFAYILPLNYYLFDLFNREKSMKKKTEQK